MPSSVAFRERGGELVDIDGATLCLILELLKPIENELIAQVSEIYCDFNHSETFTMSSRPRSSETCGS